jgi:hypothetical protein
MEDDKKPDEKLILIKLDNLIERVNWYKTYIMNDVVIPPDVSTFTERNIDLMNNIETLTNLLQEYKKSTESGEYEYSPEQKLFKYLQIAVMLKYLGFY